MVTAPVRRFDAGEPGTPVSTWRTHLAHDSRTPVSLDGVRRLIVVGAHPDDETLGAGGLILLAQSRQIPVDLVCVTDGRGSHPASPTHTAADLAARRADEWAEAAGLLGVERERRHWLGVPDGEVSAHVDDLVNVLVDLVALGDGEGTVVVAPWRRDGHPDHEAVGRAAAVAARRTDTALWEFPIWAWHWSEPADQLLEELRPLALPPRVRATKRTATEAHASQVRPLSSRPGDEALLSPTMLAHFDQPSEWFLISTGDRCVDDALERLHRDVADPWGVDSRWYERRKRDLLLSLLPRVRFARVLEIGCSTGALTEALASRADAVVGVDSSPTALASGRRRLRDHPGVELCRLDVPREWPEGEFDLVVLSEVGYFLSPDALRRVIDRVAACVTEDAVVVLCHWRHPIRGWLLDARTVHEEFGRRLPVPVQASYDDRDVELRVHASSWLEPDR